MEPVAEKIRELAARRHIPEAQLSKWLAMGNRSASSLCEIAERLRLRTGQLARAIDLLDEIAVRDRSTIESILARDEVRRTTILAGSTPARAAAFLAALEKLRFPRLQRMAERLRSEIDALRLPAGISVILPKSLASDEIAIKLVARNPSDLSRLIDALKAREEAIARVFGILGGDEV